MSEISLLLDYVKQHAEEDTRRFEAVESKLDRIEANTSSLLQSRSFSQGVSKAIVTILTITGGAVGSIVTLIAASFLSL